MTDLPKAIDRSATAPLAYNAMVLRQPFSGVEVAVLALAEAMAAATARRMIIHVPDTVRTPPNTAMVDWRRHHIPFSSRSLRIVWEQMVLPSVLRRDGVALLHAPAYVAPFQTPCPTVLTLYDLHVFTHPALCRRGNRWHYRLRMPPSVRRAAAVIVPSNHTRAMLAEQLGENTARKVHVIPLGVSKQFTPISSPEKRAETRRRLDLPDTYLLFVGNADPRKNLPMLLDAWHCIRRRYPKMGLVLAGRGHVSTGAPPQPHILGYVRAEDLPVLYSMAQALVYPSIDEGFGLPAVEAMACGCPVVCTHHAPAEISPAAILRVQPDARAIASSVDRLIRDPAERAARVRTGIAAAAQRSWEVVARQTFALYDQLL